MCGSQERVAHLFGDNLVFRRIVRRLAALPLLPKEQVLLGYNKARDLQFDFVGKSI